MKKSATEIQAILFSGGSVIVDATDYPALSLRGLAVVAKSHGANITIRNAQKLSTLECKNIALASGGQGIITFDFTV